MVAGWERELLTVQDSHVQPEIERLKLEREKNLRSLREVQTKMSQKTMDKQANIAEISCELYSFLIPYITSKVGFLSFKKSF